MSGPTTSDVDSAQAENGESASASSGLGPTVGWEQGASRAIDVPGAPGFVFASMLSRFVGYVIDGLIVAILTVIPLVILETLMPGVSDLKLLITAVVSMALGFAYYVLSWTSARRATIGQRLVKIQVGNAFNGRTLTHEQAASRWLALGFPAQAFGFIPAVAGLASSALLLWYIILLIATATNTMRQGPHDRFARSAVVQRTGESVSGLVLGCVLVVVILGAVVIASIVALILLGSQVQDILSTVGQEV